MHNHPFDARHTFKVSRFADIERFAEWDESYTEPPEEEYQSRVCLHLTPPPSFSQNTYMFPRNIFVLGSRTRKAATNM